MDSNGWLMPKADAGRGGETLVAAIDRPGDEVV